jgi:hypothetical protein
MIQRKKIKKKTAIIFFILFTLFFINIIKANSSSDMNFTINIEKNNFYIFYGESAQGLIYINSTLDSNENISLYGEWIGDEPENVTVIISDQFGVPAFSSRITFICNSNKTGSYTYRITGEGTNYSSNDNFQIHILPDVEIGLQTDKTIYHKGESMKIFGSITSNTSTIMGLSENVTITLERSPWKRTFIAQLIDNTFEISYDISFGDPEGLWNVTSITTDKDGNIISSIVNISVTLPPDKVRYKVVWYSPSRSAIYQRGETFNVSLYVTEDGTGVKNLSTDCILPKLDRINLTELQPGYYRGSYKIPWDAQTGIWIVTFQGTKGSGSSLSAGAGNISIKIKPSILSIELLEPSSDKYYFKDNLIIKCRLRYSDKTYVKNAIVTASILEENLTLLEEADGIYSTDYLISDEGKGSFLMEISFCDAYGNTASLTKVIPLSQRQKTDFPLLFVSYIAAAGSIAVFLVLFLRRRLSLIHIRDVQEEIREVMRLQKEAAEKYYKEGSISRHSYDLLRAEHNERLAELEKGDKKTGNKKEIITRIWQRNDI